MYLHNFKVTLNMRTPESIESLVHFDLDDELQSFFVKSCQQYLASLPSNVRIFCEGGSVVLANKNILGLFSKLVRETCKDDTEKEMTTLIADGAFS